MAELRVIEPDDPAENVIAVLEEVLELARAGELSSVGIAMAYRDGRTGQRLSDTPFVGVLIASAGIMHHRLIAELIEESSK